MTQQDQFIAALEALGWSRDINARTTRYTTMKPPTKATENTYVRNTGDNNARIYLGKSGAFRYSAQGTVTTAYPSPRFKAEVLRRARLLNGGNNG